MSQANITDVAKAANVSVATVSRALNEPEKVSSETQNRIKEAIKELNYRPNRLGVRLRKQKTNVLLVLVSDLGNPFFSDILYGMDETAQKHGYSLMVVSTYFNTERERSSLLALEQRTGDGAVLLSSMLPTEEINYYDAHFPIIQCCDFNEDSTAMHVSIDNYKATEQVVEYFLALGRKRIAAIGLSNNFISSRLRAKAYRETLERHGIAFEPDSSKSFPIPLNTASPRRRRCCVCRSRRTRSSVCRTPLRRVPCVRWPTPVSACRRMSRLSVLITS